MSKHIDHILAQGVIAGLLTPAEEVTERIARPWPLTALTGIGAWFAAIPLAVLLYIVGGGERSLALGIISAALIYTTVGILRSRPALFAEQFALAGLVASSLVMYFYIAENGDKTTACLTMFAVFAIAVYRVPQTWLRVLLGAAMGVTGIFGLHNALPYLFTDQGAKLWPVIGMSMLWCLLSVLPSRQSLSLRHRARLEAISLGMSAAIVCSPFWVNDSFFFFEVNGWLGRFGHGLLNFSLDETVVSVCITIASSIWMMVRWPQSRALWFMPVALVLAIFAWCIPSLCVLALVCTVALTSGRKSTAILCACMSIWWLGNFYFSLQWVLMDKAMLFASSGVVVALTSAFLVPDGPLKKKSAVSYLNIVKVIKPTRIHACALLGCAVLTLGIANVSILQKEALEKNGTTLFVQLQPVDPRSLVQGDYMSLSFGIGEFDPAKSSTRGNALIGTVDEFHVWSVNRLDDGRPLAAKEVKINLSGTPGHPIFVSDAWFFKEGEAHRWQKARFGEFRVRTDGNASLVGLRGANLEEL